MRIPFKVDVVRDRGALARVADGGRIENVFRMQIMNATEATQQFHISVSGMPDLEVASENDIDIASTQARWVAVRVLGPMDGATPGSHTIQFEIAAKSGIGKLSEKAVFIVPR
jgi:polyferredoxin